MEKKKVYQAPRVKRVRLDIKSSVMGMCQQSPDFVISPTCVIPETQCPSAPTP